MEEQVRFRLVVALIITGIVIVAGMLDAIGRQNEKTSQIFHTNAPKPYMK